MTFLKNCMLSPEDYANAAVIAREVGEEMLVRLEWMTLQPRVIVDMGCGTGEMSVKLAERYPEAQVVALDQSLAMLQFAREQRQVPACLCAEAETLPFADASVDLIYANLLFPWVGDVSKWLQECRRVLRKDGVLMLTALGVDTFREWRDVFLQENIPVLVDLHDVGDELVRAGFADPVIDVDYFQLTYRSTEKFIEEMRASGMLGGKLDLSSLEEIQLFEGDVLSVTFEVVFAHAFGVGARREVSSSSDGVARFPVSRLRGRR